MFTLSSYDGDYSNGSPNYKFSMLVPVSIPYISSSYWNLAEGMLCHRFPVCSFWRDDTKNIRQLWNHRFCLWILFENAYYLTWSRKTVACAPSVASVYAMNCITSSMVQSLTGHLSIWARVDICGGFDGACDVFSDFGVVFSVFGEELGQEFVTKNTELTKD